jgi:hypothetical protein
MSDIVLSQPGGAGALTADGAVQVGTRCYLSATNGFTAVSWTLLSVPTGSAATAKLHSRLGWYFDPDVKSETPYVVRMTDSVSGLHTNSFYASGRPASGVPELDVRTVIDTTWFGVKGDGRRITDGILSGGAKILQSATAAFTLDDVGRSVLLRTANQIGTGTLAFTNASTDVVGTGTNLPVDLPIIGGGTGTGQPESGGGIYAVGVGYLAAQYSTGSGGHIVLAQPASQTISGCTWYKEAHIATTIARFISATQVELATAATISETSVHAVIATDNTTAIDDAIKYAIATGACKVTFPAGLIGISANLVYTGVSGLTLAGSLTNKTTLVDLRKQSDEVAYPNAAHSYGILSFVTSDGIRIMDMGFDASLSCLGIVHSAGGSPNNSGSRIGFYMETCSNSAYIRLRSENLGARDEHCFVNGDSPNFLFDECYVVANNNVSLNCNGGYVSAGVPACKGLRIINCVATGIQWSAGSFTVMGCDVTSLNTVGMLGGMTCDLIGVGVIANNTFHDIDNSTNGVGVIDLFGNNDVDAAVTITGISIKNVLGAWQTGGGAAIHLKNYGGSARLTNINVTKCTGSATGGRHVYIEGASTGKVHIESGSFDGGTNITVGIALAADVPSGAVTLGKSLRFGSSVTTRLVAANTGGFGRTDEMQTISSTGTTAVNLGVTCVLVTANGAVTVTLPDPTLCRGHAVEVKNDTTQAGTTTIGTAAGNIDGSATFARTGALRAAVFRSDGTNWKIVSSYL